MSFLRSRPRASSRRGDDYEDFRLGLRFADVRAELKEEQRRAYERGEYMFVTRRTVLGRMHEYKQRAYEAYRREMDRIAAEGGRPDDDEDLPF